MPAKTPHRKQADAVATFLSADCQNPVFFDRKGGLRGGHLNCPLHVAVWSNEYICTCVCHDGRKLHVLRAKALRDYRTERQER